MEVFHDAGQATSRGGLDTRRIHASKVAWEATLALFRRCLYRRPRLCAGSAPVGAPASGSAGCGLDRSPDLLANAPLPLARGLLPSGETPRAATGLGDDFLGERVLGAPEMRGIPTALPGLCWATVPVRRWWH